VWIRGISKEKLINSMSERIRLVIEHKGEITKY
jgi:hypothetical protein